jgi:hypothetical protein
MPIFDRIGSFVSSFPDAPIAIRIGVFFLVWLLLWLPIAIPISIAVKWQPFNPLENRQKLPLVISLYLLAPLVLWAFAQWQHFPFSAYGLRLDQSVLLGMGIGVLGLGLLFGIQTVLGWLRWRVENLRKWRAALAPTLLLALWIGWTVGAGVWILGGCDRVECDFFGGTFDLGRNGECAAVAGVGADGGCAVFGGCGAARGVGIGLGVACGLGLDDCEFECGGVD